MEPDSALGAARDLIQVMIEAIVDQPDAVLITTTRNAELTTLNLSVAPTDVGKIIEKQGRTARCLRTILNAAGMKAHRRFALDIMNVPQAKSRPL